MRVLRTPDERFEALEGYDFAPCYTEVTDADGTLLRIHHVDEGPRDEAPILLRQIARDIGLTIEDLLRQRQPNGDRFAPASRPYPQALSGAWSACADSSSPRVDRVPLARARPLPVSLWPIRPPANPGEPTLAIPPDPSAS